MKHLAAALAALVLAPACATDSPTGDPDPIEEPQPMAAFTITSDLASADLVLGGEITFAVTVTRNHGFSEPITIDVTGLPAGVATQPVTIAADGDHALMTLTASVNAAMGQPLTAQVNALGGDVVRSSDLRVRVIGLPGMLDPTFASGGRDLRALAPDRNESFYGSVVLPDGSTITGGIDDTSHEALFVRYDANGAIVPWGDNTSGVVRTSSFLTSTGGTALRRDSQGRVLGAFRSGNKTRIVRVLPDGQIDPSYATATEHPRSCTDMVLDSADRPLLACTDTTWAVSLVRLGTNGQLDPTFGGGDGVQPLGYFGSDPRLSVDEDGRVIAGFTNNQQPEHVLVRLLANGAFDPSFDFDGYKVITDVGDDSLVDIASLGADLYLAVRGTESLSVQHLNEAGAMDTSFGTAGEYRRGQILPTALASVDDRLVLSAYDVNTSAPMLVQLDLAGQAVEMGENGCVQLPIAPGQSPSVLGLTVVDEHRVVLDGRISNGLTLDAMRARVWL